MKYTAILAVVALLVIGAVAQTQPNAARASSPATFTVDTKASIVNWTGRKVLGKHTGTINIADGSLSVSGDQITGGTFTIDMKTIKDLDQTDPDNNAKLVHHLSSDDFFGVEKFPTATFVITAVKPLGNSLSGATHSVMGNLTIKGITKDIAFPARIMVADKMLTASTSFNINRTRWGLKYGSGSFFDNLGDNAIYDEFTIELNLVAKAR